MQICHKKTLLFEELANFLKNQFSSLIAQKKICFLYINFETVGTLLVYLNCIFELASIWCCYFPVSIFKSIHPPTTGYWWNTQILWTKLRCLSKLPMKQRKSQKSIFQTQERVSSCFNLSNTIANWNCPIFEYM